VGADRQKEGILADSRSSSGRDLSASAGFHLAVASRVRIEEIIGEFRRLGVQHVARCHCTGDQARELFHEVYDKEFHACGVGWQW
jgi:metal-dependent hydrolase (beta-lactamase superfamily II)